MEEIKEMEINADKDSFPHSAINPVLPLNAKNPIC